MNTKTVGLLLVSAGLLFTGCGDSSGAGGAGGGASTTATGATAATGTSATGAGAPVLTVNNTISWCHVTVTVGTAAPVSFDSASQAFPTTAGTTVTLNATPHPTFMPVKWTGVTTMNGADATYTVTSAAAQAITACCALSDGSGC